MLLNGRLKFFWGIEEFLFIERKNSTKKTKQRNKIQHNNRKIYISMYNYELYTIARLITNKSIQAVQLIS